MTLSAPVIRGYGYAASRQANYCCSTSECQPYLLGTGFYDAVHLLCRPAHPAVAAKAMAAHFTGG